MPSNTSSDRERLLRLIDGDPSVIKEISSRQRTLRSLDMFYGFLDFFESFFIKLLNGVASFRHFQVATLNRFLIICMLALCAYLGLQAFRETVFESQAVLADLSGTETNALAENVSRYQPLEYYLDKLTVRDLFKAQRATPAGSRLASLNDLRFVGVDWSESPTAMIENINEGKTYFVKAGEKIKSIDIKEVRRDKVVFSFKGKIYELQ